MDCNAVLVYVTTLFLISCVSGVIVACMADAGHREREREKYRKYLNDTKGEL